MEAHGWEIARAHYFCYSVVHSHMSTYLKEVRGDDFVATVGCRVCRATEVVKRGCTSREKGWVWSEMTTGNPFVWTAAPCQTDKTDRYQGKFTFCCNIKATVEKSEIQPVFLPYSSNPLASPPRNRYTKRWCLLESFSAKLTESFVTIHPPSAITPLTLDVYSFLGRPHPKTNLTLPTVPR